MKPKLKNEFPGGWPPRRVQDAPCCGNPMEYVEDVDTQFRGPAMAICAHCGEFLVVERGKRPLHVPLTDEDLKGFTPEARKQIEDLRRQRVEDPWIVKRAAQLRALRGKS